MSVRLLFMLCIGLSLTTEAHELQQAARGLDVSYEELGGAVAVNGLPLTIARVVGPAVPALAERLIQQWREDSGIDSVRVSRCCGWNLASLILATESRVIQWRTTASGAELLWSAVNLTVAVRAPPEPAVPLLTQCSWSTPVHGLAASRQYLQVSARCPLDAPATLELVTRRLAREGWRWQRRGPLMVQAEHGRVQVQLIAAPRDASTDLVLVESRPAAGSRP
jgi:hypothetical protein